MEKSTGTFGFICASCTITAIVALGVVTAATLVWVMML